MKLLKVQVRVFLIGIKYDCYQTAQTLINTAVNATTPPPPLLPLPLPLLLLLLLHRKVTT